MIAGETEQLWADHLEDASYDDFLFFGNKEKRAQRKAARNARRKKRRTQRMVRRASGNSLFSKLGDVYKDLGGATGIGSAIDAAIHKPVTTSQNEEASDFVVDLGDTKRNTKTDATTIGLYVVMGVVVVGGVALLVYQSQKDNDIRVSQN